MIIQKYGGALLATQEQREKAARNIIAAYREGKKPVVIISAMGRKDQPYSTDALLDLISNGSRPESCRETDLLMSTGEIIAVVVMAHLVRSLGGPAFAMTGWEAGIMTDEHFGEARVLKVEAEKLNTLLSEDKIPIVAGFQGLNRHGDITTLGRDGSDITALALGVALKAESVEIYKDSLGVQTLDPSKYQDPQIITDLTFEEAGEMADEGAKVLHKRCITLAERYKFPILVKNLETPGVQTLVDHQPEPEMLEAVKMVTSVVEISDIVQFKLIFEGNGKEKTAVFKELAAQRISIDMINICGDLLFFTVQTHEREKVEELLRERQIEFRVFPDICKIASIGTGMKGVPGVMARIQGALFKAGVDILHSSDSHISISCLVREADREKAVLALREAFNL